MNLIRSSDDFDLIAAGSIIIVVNG